MWFGVISHNFCSVCSYTDSTVSWGTLQGYPHVEVYFHCGAYCILCAYFNMLPALPYFVHLKFLYWDCKCFEGNWMILVWISSSDPSKFGARMELCTYCSVRSCTCFVRVSMRRCTRLAVVGYAHVCVSSKGALTWCLNDFY